MSKKPTSINRQLNAAWDIYQADHHKETQLVVALTRLAKTIAHSIGIQDPDDVVQDALLKVWSYKTSYKPTKAGFATWANSVMRQVCHDHKNKLSQQHHTQVALDTLPKHDFDKQVADSGWHIEAQERGVAIEQELSRLSRPTREVVLLYSKGWSMEEIAQQLGITRIAAEHRWRRALEELGGGD